jgi:hypothetical protein
MGLTPAPPRRALRGRSRAMGLTPAPPRRVRYAAAVVGSRRESTFEIPSAPITTP